jgi:transcriptional regulator with XRE-family HTH domain
MNEGQAREPQTHRARLGEELKRLRVLAGLSGSQIAQAVGVSQSTVSRIERGDSVPSAVEVNAWADAARLGEERRMLVLSLAEAAVNEVITHRERLAGGLAAIQDSVHDLERTARTLRHFQPGTVPGLLQTAEYARRILTFADPSADIGQAVAARMARQGLLYEADRSFEFLLTESALRYRPGPEDVLTAQLDHLAAVVTLNSISFGVIPVNAEMHAIIRCAFIIYEDRIDDRPPFAFVETPHASLSASDPADVAVYQSQLEAFRSSAVYGTEAIDIVRSIARPLTNKKGQRSLCTRSRHGHTARRQPG